MAQEIAGRLSGVAVMPLPDAGGRLYRLNLEADDGRVLLLEHRSEAGIPGDLVAWTLLLARRDDRVVVVLAPDQEATVDTGGREALRLASVRLVAVGPEGVHGGTGIGSHRVRQIGVGVDGVGDDMAQMGGVGGPDGLEAGPEIRIDDEILVGLIGQYLNGLDSAVGARLKDRLAADAALMAQARRAVADAMLLSTLAGGGAGERSLRSVIRSLDVFEDEAIGQMRLKLFDLGIEVAAETLGPGAESAALIARAERVRESLPA